ncbi:hypothetical protein BSKO_04865 [Bryopsis sp. KO-2023]|nr:hypothetical protein BSKO_04865 [Bryopsis sp. KO-2023]
MRAVLAWQESPPEKDGVRNICYDVAFNPDGTEVVCGIGARVYIFGTADGDLISALKGHKDAVYCVDYAANGKRFASGGADATIIIWTNKGEGVLKYSHNDSIQALAYSPTAHQLASGTATDFGLWSAEQKSVAKHKVTSKILSLAWTCDGQYIALGHFDGNISIRDKSGDEKVSIQRDAPVWSMVWRPGTSVGEDILAAGCWDGSLSFYQLSGGQIGVDKDLGFNPCSVSFFGNGEYLMVGGTDRKVHLFTKEGTKLLDVAERNGWIWCVKRNHKTNCLVVGCQDGSVALYQLVFSTVHGLYQDRYAYRESLSDVIIKHLITEQKVCIKCRDYVKKIAVYKDKLAVQLSHKIVIYELSGADHGEMRYQVAAKIEKTVDCNLLVVTSMHVILCLDRRLQSYGFEGKLGREWVLDSVIRYIKVIGGPTGREGFLLGLKSGEIVCIFVDNPFPIIMMHHTAAVRCLDINNQRNKVALVDENNMVVVYDLKMKEKTFEAKGANSVAWNSDFADMLCFSGNGVLSIKTGSLPVHQQKLQGFVVGFKRSKIFCLQYVEMQTIDVPQSVSMRRFLAEKDFQSAYKVACLGVTDKDWRELAMECLLALEVDAAKKAFIRVRDAKYLETVDRMSRNKSSLQDFLPEVFAYQGRYQEAARLYGNMGKVDDAVRMFSDLKQFDEAKRWTEEFSSGQRGDQKAVQDLISRQAEWSEEVNDLEGAADMYIRARKYDKAVSILVKHGWLGKLLQVAREMDASEKALLRKCANAFRKAKNIPAAREAYTKLGDLKGLAQMFVEGNEWEEAFLVAKQDSSCAVEVHAPYAMWLAENDRFDEARIAFRTAGMPERSVSLLHDLAEAAVSQQRFSDASFYYYQLACESLQGDEENSPPDSSRENPQQRNRYLSFMADAEIYFAYSVMHDAVTSPFQTIDPVSLFNAARFLAMQTSSRSTPPKGVRMVNIYQVLATSAKDMGAYKLARMAYHRLQTLRIPPSWQKDLDLQTVCIRAKPFMDQEDLLPICYRCGTTNPLLNTQGDICVNCGATFIRSFLTFEHLPLVEFRLDAGISPTEAVELIGEGKGSSRRGASEQNVSMDDHADVLRLDDTEDLDVAFDDPFAAQMMVPNAPIIADRETLPQLAQSEVIVWRGMGGRLPARFFRVTDTSVPLCCGPCGHFFEEDEFEMWSLERGFLPFSRQPLEGLEQKA